MTTKSRTFDECLSALDSDAFLPTLCLIQRGVERETLRIQQSGRLATTPHPVALGSALTHDSITTDFSEALLEFITPPEASIQTTQAQLRDIHKFVYANLGDELLWPMSMPCFIEDEAHIPIADYGTSNIGKMKKVYRMGLRNRYGSMMQAIAGVHFNFSLPREFWQQWASLHEEEATTEQVSAYYFSLIRNYRRTCWLIPYLFGASPALCRSFLEGDEQHFDFATVGKGTIYLPYATSLRMSDLGYTNADQSALRICYNSLDDYVAVLRSAMNTQSAKYAQFNAGEEGDFQQLSKNILQIENELYSPIRPKQPTKSMEKPTDALVRRGVEYIEVRALDVNPFSPLGVEASQMAFLDVFLLTCVLNPSAAMTEAQMVEANFNMDQIVLQGRKPYLNLQKDGEAIPMKVWCEQLFAQYRKVAALLDKANGHDKHSSAVEDAWQRVCDPSLTPSGKILDWLLANNQDNGALGMQLAQQYAKQACEQSYMQTTQAEMQQSAERSILAQQEIESAEEVPFADFITRYFAEPPAQKLS